MMQECVHYGPRHGALAVQAKFPPVSGMPQKQQQHLRTNKRIHDLYSQADI